MKIHSTQIVDRQTTIWASPVHRPNRSRMHRALPIIPYHLGIMQAIIRARAVGLPRAIVKASDVIPPPSMSPLSISSTLEGFTDRHPKIADQQPSHRGPQRAGPLRAPLPPRGAQGPSPSQTLRATALPMEGSLSPLDKVLQKAHHLLSNPSQGGLFSDGRPV